MAFLSFMLRPLVIDIWLDLTWGGRLLLLQIKHFLVKHWEKKLLFFLNKKTINTSRFSLFSWKVVSFFITLKYYFFQQIISSSSESELEICVQLIDDNFERTVLEEQVLMLTDEAVFEFAPLGSKTKNEKVLIEVWYNGLGFDILNL